MYMAHLLAIARCRRNNTAKLSSKLSLFRCFNVSGFSRSLPATRNHSFEVIDSFRVFCKAISSAFRCLK